MCLPLAYSFNAAVSVLMKLQHMVVFLAFEIVSLPQGMKNPRLKTGDLTVLV